MANLTIEQLAYEVAAKQLASQKEDLRNYRNQAAFAAATTGLIANVFAQVAPKGALSLRTNDIPFLGLDLRVWMVAILFGSSIACAILVIAQWKRVTFDHKPSWILQEMRKNRTVTEIMSDLAEDADGFFDENETVIDNAKSYLWWSLVLGWLQIVPWLLILQR